MAQNLYNEILAERVIIEDSFLATATEKFPDVTEHVRFGNVFIESRRVFHSFFYGPYEFKARVTGSNDDLAWITRVL